MIIYRLFNTVTAKSYIGQTVQPLSYRMSGHRASAKSGVASPINASIRKHGWSAFTVETLEECVDEADMDMAERFWIETFNSLSPAGYNLEAGGNRNKRLSEETKAKMGAAQLGRTHSDEAKARMRVSSTGIRHSDETKAALSRHFKGRGLGVPKSPAACARMSIASRSSETVAARAMAMKGEGGPSAKLTWPRVRKMRLDYAAGGRTYTSLAAEHGVSRAAATKIISLKTWIE